jgi:hypothetical protein
LTRRLLVGGLAGTAAFLITLSVVLSLFTGGTSIPLLYALPLGGSFLTGLAISKLFADPHNGWSSLAVGLGAPSGLVYAYLIVTRMDHSHGRGPDNLGLAVAMFFALPAICAFLGTFVGAGSIGRSSARLARREESPLAYWLLAVLVMLPAVAAPSLAVTGVLGGRVQDSWCERVQLPEYERTLGFRLGDPERPDGAVREGGWHFGVVWVDPNGPFSRAGVRHGDLFDMRQGLAGFCSDLARVSKGEPVELHVMNIEAIRRGDYHRRSIIIDVGPQR